MKAELKFIDSNLSNRKYKSKIAIGSLKFGSHDESFMSPLWFWTKDQYRAHWINALTQVLMGMPSALIQSWTPNLRKNGYSGYMCKFYPQTNGNVFMQQQLILHSEYVVRKTDWSSLLPLTPDRRQTHDEDGIKLSEWIGSLIQIEEMLYSVISDIGKRVPASKASPPTMPTRTAQAPPSSPRKA